MADLQKSGTPPRAFSKEGIDLGSKSIIRVDGSKQIKERRNSQIEKVVEITIVKKEPMGCSGTTGAGIGLTPKDDLNVLSEQLLSDQQSRHGQDLSEPYKQSPKTE